MLKKDAKSNKWRARIYFKGKQISMATFDRRDDAQKWEAKQKLALVTNDWQDDKAGNMTVAAVILEFNESRAGTISAKTVDTDEANLRLHIPQKLARRPIRSVQSSELLALYSSLSKRRSHATVKRIRDSTMSLFNYAVAMGYAPTTQ